jgi:hypothetical protein
VAVELRRPVWIGVGVAVALVPWLYVAYALQHTGPPIVSSQQPTAVVWAGRVFPTQHDLAAWLRSRGASYDAWVAAHPDAAAPFTTTQTPTTTAPATHEHSSHPAAQPEANASHRSTLRTIFVTFALVAGALLVALACAPDSLLTWIRPEWREATVEVRLAAFAIAISMGAGVLVAELIG